MSVNKTHRSIIETQTSGSSKSVRQCLLFYNSNKYLVLGNLPCLVFFFQSTQGENHLQWTGPSRERDNEALQVHDGTWGGFKVIQSTEIKKNFCFFAKKQVLVPNIRVAAVVVMSTSGNSVQSSLNIRTKIDKNILACRDILSCVIYIYCCTVLSGSDY